MTEEIVDALQQQGRPLQIQDAAGRMYYVLTDQQFQQYVYDDSELSPGDMMAAAGGLSSYPAFPPPASRPCKPRKYP